MSGKRGISGLSPTSGPSQCKRSKQHVSKNQGQDSRMISLCNERYREAWRCVLPFLPLTDVIAVSKVDKRSEELVADLFTTGSRYEIRITQKFLERHPVGRNVELYSQIGRYARSLTVSGVRKIEDVEAVFFHFKSLHRLTMNNINITETQVLGYPFSLRQLTIKYCRIAKNYTEKWFSRMKSVKVVDIRSSYDFNPEILNALPVGVFQLTLVDTRFVLKSSKKSSLRTLILKADRISISNEIFSGLRTLKLTTWVMFYNHPPELNCPELQYFELTLSDTPLKTSNSWSVKPVIAMGCARTLKTLVIPFLPVEVHELAEFTQLRHLTIRNGLEVEEEEQLLKWVKGLDRQLALNYKIVPTPGYNLIFKLNDDCLRKIYSYLSPRDLMTIFPLHPRIKQSMATGIIFRGHLQYFDIYNIACYENEVCEILGRGATSLSISGENAMKKVLPFLPNINKLSITDTELTDLEAIEKFPAIQNLSFKFHYERIHVSEEYLTKFFRHLNPTLTSLHDGFRSEYGEPYLELHNLRYLYVFKGFLHTVNPLFWTQNQNLRELHIEDEFYHYDGGFIDSRDRDHASNRSLSNWRAIVAMESLKVLHLRDAFPYGALIHLEEVSMSFKTDEPESTAGLGTFGPQLRKLTYEIEFFPNGGSRQTCLNPIDSIIRYQNLESLELNYYLEWSTSGVNKLVTLKKLKVLRISFADKRHSWGIESDEESDGGTIAESGEDKTLRIVECLPKLIDFVASNSNTKDEVVIKRIREYLRSEKPKRDLRFNRVWIA